MTDIISPRLFARHKAASQKFLYEMLNISTSAHNATQATARKQIIRLLDRINIGTFVK